MVNKGGELGGYGGGLWRKRFLLDLEQRHSGLFAHDPAPAPGADPVRNLRPGLNRAARPSPPRGVVATPPRGGGAPRRRC